MVIVLARASASDRERAWAIQRVAFTDLVTRTRGGWTEELERGAAADFDPEHTRLVQVDGALVGWVTTEHHPDHDWLELVVVDVAHQGRGIGTAVMRRLQDEAVARGVSLWLSVYRENRARRLYARLGFAELPRDPIRMFMVFPATTPLVPPR